MTGGVTETTLEDRAALDARLADATTPNAVVLADGTMLRRSREAQKIIEQHPDQSESIRRCRSRKAIEQTLAEGGVQLE